MEGQGESFSVGTSAAPAGGAATARAAAIRSRRLRTAGRLVLARSARHRETAAICALGEWQTGANRWSILLQIVVMLERRRQGTSRERPSREAAEQAALELLARHGSQVLATARRYAATPEDA